MTAIRTATLADKQNVLDTLTLAFARDPMTRYWWRDAQTYMQWWPRFLFAMGERGFDAQSVFVTSNFEAASIWLPPGVEPDGEKLGALDLPGTEESAKVSMALREEMDRFHPHDPHWYLWTIGVDPSAQGRGFGSALLGHTLAQIDARGEAAYLESSDPRNVPLYERHGFEALGLIQVHDTPPLTPMLRRPR